MQTPATALPLDPKLLVLPDNASLFTRVRVAWRVLRVIRGNEGNPEYGQTINACLDGHVYVKLAERMRCTGDGRRMLTERPSLEAGHVDLGALEQLPAGTLGHEFARYFRDNKITPFETTLQIRSDVDYIGKRYRETHDLLHLVTGYGIDVMGELELQAYALGNLGIRTAVLILVFGLLSEFKGHPSGHSLPEFLRRLRAAYRRGRASPLFLDFWFEHHWRQSVSELRTRLCAPLQPRP